MNHGSLFSGMGGFDLAAEWMGWKNIFHCESNEFCQRILNYYWPDADSYGDIKKSDFSKHYGTVDIISGGFPCQPYSHSGKRLGKQDDRHLWPQMLRAIREVSPRYIVGENVRGFINWNRGVVFDEVQADLETEGYEVLPFLLPACSVNAPQRRERIWMVAYSHNAGCRQSNEAVAGRLSEQSNGIHLRENGSGSFHHSRWESFPSESPICFRDDGLSPGLDKASISFPRWRKESIRAAGNAIVPQVAFQIFQVIQQMENQRKKVI